jgi:beta-glucosidase
MMAAAAVRGYQGIVPGGAESILACAKHFVGDGGTTGGVDQGNTEVDELTLRTLHMAGYASAIEAGVGSIMVSYSSWNGLKMHGHSYLLTHVLKGELGFQGFLVSDWGGIDQLPGDFSADIETSINAGLDMIMVPDRYREFISTLHALVERGRVPVERIDDAVRRILRVKMRLGLFERPYADRTLLSTVGSDAHRAIARECVRQSIVVLKNAGNTLPLRPNVQRIHVAGKSADDLGVQCGGWTITWQGSTGAITDGTTILQAVRQAVGSGTTVTYSRDGSGAAGAEAGIVVIGETPYAEGYGDRDDLHLATEDVAALARVKGAGVPTVAVLISGRPMIIEPLLGACDAFVAAWLPGTEGTGVADVLFGTYHPTGRLSHTWPRYMGQIPINIGDAVYDPLFPYGFGLSY